MALIAVERMKLTSTRAPWWCVIAAIIGVPALAAAVAASTGVEVSLVNVVGGYPLGLTIIMAMAALAVTTEFNYGTIRTSFLAAPSRSGIVFAKALVLGLTSAAVGLVVAAASWGIANIIRPSADLSLSTVTDWRQIFGLAPIFGLAGVISVAVGILIRRTAGAVAAVVLWPSAVEPLVGILPGIGVDIGNWLPFTAARRFLVLGDVVEDGGPGPWLSLGYFAAVTGVLLVVAVAVARRRDA